MSGIAGLPAFQALKDGRTLEIRLAGPEDVPRVAAEHPLPRDSRLSERALRAYYAVKARLYVTSPEAGIVVGDVGGELAGFVCFEADPGALSRRGRRPGAAAWVLGQALTGRLGGPKELWSFVRWAWQHFRSARKLSPPEEMPRDLDAAAEVGTVHTVPAFRRRGVARALMRATEAHLTALGAERLALWVAAENTPAIELYRRDGYLKLGELERIGECCWRMGKTLT